MKLTEGEREAIELAPPTHLLALNPAVVRTQDAASTVRYARDAILEVTILRLWLNDVCVLML